MLLFDFSKPLPQLLFLLQIFNIISDCFAVVAVVQQQQHQHLVPANRDVLGIRITAASCQGREYKSSKVYRAVKQGHKYVKNLRNLRIGDKGLRYTPLPTEQMPFKDIYYFAPLKYTGLSSKYRDLVIFTWEGELAKVVTQIEDEKNLNWIYQDCTLTPLMVPAEYNF